MERRHINRRSALPSTKQPRAKQLAALLARDSGEVEWVVVEEFVEFGSELVQLAVDEEGAVLCPWRARDSVSGCTADEDAWWDDDLAWKGWGEGSDGG